jgi:hypothetical protein
MSRKREPSARNERRRKRTGVAPFRVLPSPGFFRVFALSRFRASHFPRTECLWPAFQGRRACEIDERPLSGEYLLHKEHASAFAGTPLIGHLVARRVDTLLITGCSTSACVRATATDAKSNQLRPIIVREAVQDRSEIAHEWTLFDFQARFADVVGLAEALRYLQTLQRAVLPTSPEAL